MHKINKHKTIIIINKTYKKLQTTKTSTIKQKKNEIYNKN